MRRLAPLALTALAALALAGSAQPQTRAPWDAAAAVRLALSSAETELVLGGVRSASSDVERAQAAANELVGQKSADRDATDAAFGRARAAVTRADTLAFAAARMTIVTTLLDVAFRNATAAARRGDVASARSWLLVREFRPPTRFSRAAADATLALDGLAGGKVTPAAAAQSVRNDLLDTYEGRLRSALDAVRESEAAGFDVRAAEAAATAHGYWGILRPSYRAQRGAKETASAETAFAALIGAASAGRSTAAARARAERAFEGFRAAPLSHDEQLRRAGQLERFLKLVPIEYGRGVKDGRVALDFEIQEAITFRDGAAAAFSDLESLLLARDPAATRALGSALDDLGDALAAASRGDAVADPDTVDATTGRALELAGELYPAEWKDAAKTADFDVIAATLDRIQAAAATGEWGTAEQARLEAYGIFELGPEQRLRGLAPDLFREIEGYFWYGEGDVDGLVQLLKRKATVAEIAETRAALDEALGEAEQRIGSGPGSRVSVVTNSAIIVFREGLEAVLILAALMASMVGAQRRYRRPLMGGVLLALVASAITWVVAQTVLGSLAGWGERLEAIVSLVAIGVLLLILNWFYHRVYWQENLQDLHKRKKRVLTRTSIGIFSAQALGLLALGFSSVYREGFETVLFLQALTLEAGAWTVLEGTAIGFAAVVAVFLLVIALERKLPHKKMLVATGLLITWVLVILVGQTVQTMQKVGWVPVSPVEGLELPYWAGVWLGVYPTTEGLAAQAAAAAFVLGSYFGAEALRKRRRSRLLNTPPPAPVPVATADDPLPETAMNGYERNGAEHPELASERLSGR